MIARHTQFLILFSSLLFMPHSAFCQDAPNRAFSDLSKRFLENLFHTSPVHATSLGEHRYDHQLDQVDHAARQRRLKQAKQLLADLNAISFDSLSQDNQVDAELIRHELKRDIWEVESLREWEWNPLRYTGLPGSSIYTLLARDTGPIEDRLAAAAARCRDFPRYFQQARDSLKPALTPPLHAETAVDQNRGISRLLQDLLTPHLDALPEAQSNNLKDAIAVAEAAIEEQQTWLETQLLPNAKGNERLSEKLYREKFAYELFSSSTPEELRAQAEARMKKLHQRMYVLSLIILSEHKFSAKESEALSPEEKRELIQLALEIAYADAPTGDGVVAAAEHSLAITRDFIIENDLISMPDDPVEIIVMPEFQRGISLAYCDAPGPLEQGQKTFYAVSPPPADWTEEQVQSHLREYNRRSLHVLTIHEATPGHFVQLAHANKNPNLIRSILGSGTFIEGWAVYCEMMMVEQGFLADDPLMELIVLKWYLRDNANALIDQAVHLDGIGEEEAMDLLMNQAFQEEREAAGKYVRARLTSAQLSTYFAGYVDLIDLREAAEKEWGAQFNLKTYHDRALSFGSPPAKFVKALLLDNPVPHLQ